MSLENYRLSLISRIRELGEKIGEEGEGISVDQTWEERCWTLGRIRTYAAQIDLINAELAAVDDDLKVKGIVNTVLG